MKKHHPRCAALCPRCLMNDPCDVPHPPCAKCDQRFPPVGTPEVTK